MRFHLTAGVLAALVLAVDLGVLQLAMAATGCYVGMDIRQIAWFSVRSTAHTVLYLLVLGMIGGGLSAILSRVAPAVHRLALQSAFSFWLLGSFIYVISGRVRVSIEFPRILTGALLTLALAIIGYGFLYELLRWLRQGKIGRVVLAIAAMGAALWIPLLYTVLP